mmetsp:Transcript_3558/g.4125  ORF Transcript_3558/g.4125 Transcript_3558/m.4125 type:complete len:172 (-) Transcript_3558:121-636(-)|eukprot:CAMPEP_0204645378 /NCGR_PEP_ID=MMETSP0718-20130828/2701_1 /ASSEMBLY_ACC=CAM_ASM_000674 /TAXON_ID=230516 /ORGANISM="Chaetoceros curvisetus" /LENGTH=171 /DNA_ID=CAMNT_0051667299 /DNA_START=21 /DNA_END=536 /DNA_ORIENTATION=+
MTLWNCMRWSGQDAVDSYRYDASGYALDPNERHHRGSSTRSRRTITPSIPQKTRRKRARGSPLNRRGMITTSMILGDDNHASAGSSHCQSHSHKAIQQFRGVESCQHHIKTGPSPKPRSFSSSKGSKDPRPIRNDDAKLSDEDYTHLMGDSSMLTSKGYDDSHFSQFRHEN